MVSLPLDDVYAAVLALTYPERRVLYGLLSLFEPGSDADWNSLALARGDIFRLINKHLADLCAVRGKPRARPRLETVYPNPSFL